MKKQETNPLTGGRAECHIWSGIVPADSDPALKEIGGDPLFQKVFGAMEQLRIEESKRCKAKPIAFRGDIGIPKPWLRKEIADLTFCSLTKYYYDRPMTVNWVFPIDTTPFQKRPSR